MSTSKNRQSGEALRRGLSSNAADDADHPPIKRPIVYLDDALDDHDDSSHIAPLPMSPTQQRLLKWKPKRANTAASDDRRASDTLASQRVLGDVRNTMNGALNSLLAIYFLFGPIYRRL